MWKSLIVDSSHSELIQLQQMVIEASTNGDRGHIVKEIAVDENEGYPYHGHAHCASTGHALTQLISNIWEIHLLNIITNAHGIPL